MSHRKAPPVQHDALGMQGQRSRNQDGTLRQKRNDTHVGTIEELYHVDFGVRDDMHLGTLLEKEGVDTLSELLTKKR